MCCTACAYTPLYTPTTIHAVFVNHQHANPQRFILALSTMPVNATAVTIHVLI